VLQEIKQDFESDRWPLGCDRCRIEEEHGIVSKRQLDISRWNDHYQEYSGIGWLTGSIAFGNTCNLACITCGPWSSSRWQTEYQARYQINIAAQHFYKQGFVQEFLEHTPNIIHLDIPGGEPFLSGVREQLELLRFLIEQGRAQEISLHYTTNATVMPDKEWWNLWQHFGEIEIQLSIDGVEHKNSYIRFPSDWAVVYSNIKQYQSQQSALANLRLSVSHTVSAFNVYYLPEFLTWCREQHLPDPWLGRVHSPIMLKPTVWCDKAKDYIVEHLTASEHADCQTWANMLSSSHDDSQYFSRFVESIAWHDSYRGLDFKTTFPEMAQFI
jgi:sulfatase maturation enzyme AslB (radical SAM superfamily)